MLYHTVYRTTNKINGKVYVGKHITKNINDGYLGSGKRLRLALLKYGIDSFQKEILAVFDTEEEMNRKEAELVTEEFCLSEKSYNLCVGGRGGFSYINRNGLGLRTGAILSQRQLNALKNSHLGKPLSEETREKIKQNNIRTAESRREKVRRAQLERLRDGHLPDVRKKISDSMKKYWETHCHSNDAKQRIREGNRGKIVSEETRAKLSAASKEYHRRRNAVIV